MIRDYLLVGVLALSFLQGYASEGGHRSILRLSGSDFHRYPARMLFTPDGNLVIAYRIASSKNESSTLQIVVFDGGRETRLSDTHMMFHPLELPRFLTAL